jgi:hypothetical protein
MLVPLLCLHTAAAADLVGYRRDVYYVVDAFVAKRVERDAGRREVSWAVFWGERPRLWGRARVVSSEWIVVDGTGRVLSSSQFHALSGHIANPARRRGEPKAWLDGVQLAYDRRDVELWSDERVGSSGRSRGVTAAHADALREGVLQTLPEPSWSVVPPDSLD